MHVCVGVRACAWVWVEGDGRGTGRDGCGWGAMEGVQGGGREGVGVTVLCGTAGPAELWMGSNGWSELGGLQFDSWMSKPAVVHMSIFGSHTWQTACRSQLAPPYPGEQTQRPARHMPRPSR